MASLVELPLNNDEGLAMACEPPGLHFVHRDHLAEEVIEVRCPLVS